MFTGVPLCKLKLLAASRSYYPPWCLANKRAEPALGLVIFMLVNLAGYNFVWVHMVCVSSETALGLVIFILTNLAGYNITLLRVACVARNSTWISDIHANKPAAGYNTTVIHVSAYDVLPERHMIHDDRAPPPLV